MQSTAAVRGQPLRVAQPRRAAGAARRGAVQTQALFSFLAPPKAKAGPGKAQVSRLEAVCAELGLLCFLDRCKGRQPGTAAAAVQRILA